MNDINIQLKNLREQRGLKQSDIALKTSLKQQVISKIEQGKGVNVNTITLYANALEQEFIIIPKIPSVLENTYVYEKYLSLSQKDNNIILSHITALELLGFFSGYVNNSTIEYYALNNIEEENTLYHPLRSFNEIGFVFCKGMRCTDINRTFNDILLSYDRIDDSVILEALNTYYFKNDESFDKLLLCEKAERILSEYKEDAINYC